MKKVFAGLGVAAVLLAGCKTGEDLVLPNQSAGIELMAFSTSSSAWVCDSLGSNPTEAGVEDMLLEAAGRGYSTDADAERLLEGIVDGCPEYLPLIAQWAKNYNG